MGVPMSPMHRPIVGTLLCRVSSSIRRLSCGWLAIVAELDDVRIELAQPAVDFVEIVGRLAEVVQADDPLGAAETRNRRGDVLFQIDVLDPLGDRASATAAAAAPRCR